MQTRRVSVKAEIREKILDRDAHVCGYCNGVAYVVDHITPWAFTQDDSEENLIACCVECNQIASSFVFDSLAEKRQYIITVRSGKKWTKRLNNKYSKCIVCEEPFCEGTKKATHFICESCMSKGYEYKSDFVALEEIAEPQ